jgi:hypothetical protein
MPVTITCPFCDYSRQVPDGYPNKQAKCPKCGTPVPVPQPEGSERPGVPPWVITLLIALGVLVLFVVGTVAMMALRGRGG